MTPQVVVVGAGIIGASIAYHLAKQGARVTVLEKTRPGAGATGNSFAWLNAWGKRPRDYYELNLKGIAGWHRLQREIGPELVIQWGGGVVWAAPGEATERLQAIATDPVQGGYASPLTNADDVQALLPEAVLGPVGAACCNEVEGSLDPLRTLDVLLGHAAGLGVRIKSPCEVNGFEQTADRIQRVQTSQGIIDADFVVLANGIGIPVLAESVGWSIPLIESTGVLAHTKPCHVRLDRVALAPGAHIKQNPDGTVVTGESYGGTVGVSADEEEGRRALRQAVQFFPGLGKAELKRVSLGYRVMPRDEYPIVGFAPQHRNLYVVATHSGITLAPVLGELAAAEILGAEPAPELAPYRPARFGR